MNFRYEISEIKEIEQFLKEKNYSKFIIREIKNNIVVNGKPKRKWEKVYPGDFLDIFFNKEETNIVATKGLINIVYEDDYLIIVNKPAHQASMPNRGYYENSLANYLMNYYKEKKIDATVHLVNRLDKETSGLMIIAKYKIIHSLLSKTNINKRYYAVVKGIMKNDGQIDLPISRGEGIKRQVGIGKESLTIYRVLKTNENTLLDLELKSGRTHQIRVHLEAIGHPIIGDELYDNGDNLHLQSYFLSFLHPITKANMEFVQDLEKRLEKDI